MSAKFCLLLGDWGARASLIADIVIPSHLLT